MSCGTIIILIKKRAPVIKGERLGKGCEKELLRNVFFNEVQAFTYTHTKTPSKVLIWEQ